MSNGLISDDGVIIFALGGLGEVGKNTYCVETKNTIVIIDAGVKFPEIDVQGIKYVIPDYKYLKSSNKNKFLLITHGHEDHIGAINILIQEVNILLIYASKFAAELIRHKMSSLHIKKPSIIEYDENSFFRINNGEIKVSFFRVTHSIPDAFGIVLETSEGKIATTGDFKIDLTPIGNDIELNKIAFFGFKGIDLLLSDSTNAEIEGNTSSEKSVYQNINSIFQQVSGRIIISTFSSSISRIQQIVDIACKHNRKIVIIGRSMEIAVQFSRKNGYIKIKNSDLIDISEIESYDSNKICIICTGSQGESGSVLSKIANGEHKIHVKPNDTVIFSSSPIPGNSESINTIINILVKAGANIFTNDDNLILHSSGHPSKRDLQLMLKLFKPKFFMPIHGNYSMLKSHASVAEYIGMKKENIFVLENGDSIILKKHNITRGPKIFTDCLYLEDNNVIKPISAKIIEERKKINEEGIAIINVSLNSKYQFILKPKINFIGLNVSNDIKNKIENNIYNSIVQYLSSNLFDQVKIENLLTEIIHKETIQLIQKNPLIIPFVSICE